MVAWDRGGTSFLLFILHLELEGFGAYDSYGPRVGKEGH